MTKVYYKIPKQKKELQNRSKAGTKENETRAAFIVNDNRLEKLKAIAYWDGETIKEVINGALSIAIAKYEDKNGKIIPMANRIVSH